MKEMRRVWMTEDGWVAEHVDECTCGGPHLGHHEPSCGWEPIGKLNDAAPLRAAIEAKCEESEQVRRSSRVLPGVGPMVYVSDLRALLDDDGAAGLREHDEHVRQPLRDALTRALSELGGNHSGHWDSTGGRGSGCPVCIREREIRSELMAVLDATRPTAVDTAGEAGDG